MLINQLVLLFMEIVLLAIALGLFIPIFVLFVECNAALLPRRYQKLPAIASRPKVDVLVPAHNEAVGIKATLQSLLPQLTERDRLIVIADNCDDETAAIARALGATAIERQDPERKAKGYALDYGLQFIATDPPDVVVIVDADCIVHSGAIDRLARFTAATTRPVQASYLLQHSSNPRGKDAVSVLAFMVKNLVRLQGLNQLGLHCLLTGSGMAFPWSVISQVCLASGNLVEDMQLSLDLAMTGNTPVFCAEAKVTGLLPQQDSVAKRQRTRWEHGHLQTLFAQVPRLLQAAVSQRRFDLLAIALDLSVPPLSLLVMLWAAATGGAILAGVLGATWISAELLALEGLLILTAIFAAWLKFGRADLPLLTLLAIPLYVLWKIPLYLAFLVQPQTKWIRTDRDVVDASQS